MTDTEITKSGATSGTESEVNSETQEDLQNQVNQTDASQDEKPKTGKKSPSKTKKAPKDDDKNDANEEEENSETKNANQEDFHPESTDPGNQDSELLIKFSIEVSKENIEKEFDAALEKYAGEIKLPGFRKGKVPVEVIKSRYKDAIRDEVINQIVEKAVFDKIEKDKIKIVSRPEVIKINHEDGNDLSADVQVEIFPTVEVPELENVEVKIPTDDLKSEEFDEQKHIDFFLESHKRRVPVKREIKDGDYASLKYQSRILPSKRMTPRKDIYFIVDEKEKAEILDLYKEILGKEIGSEIIFTRSYPEDYLKKPWAGKEVEHHITVENVFESVKPELTQEFLTSIGFENEESFKNKLKEEFDRVNTQRTDDKKLKYIIDSLCDVTAFPLPKGMIEQETSQRIANSQSRFPINIKDENQAKEYIESIRSEAEKSIRFSFIVEAVKEKFNLEVTGDELENHYKNIADRNHLPLKDVRKYYMNKENSQTLKDSLLREKVIELVKEKVQIKEI